MWKARTKPDLIIEVWEKLDCESVGAAEIGAIQTVVADVFGEQAVDSSMRIARMLSDEGAELRHAEIMALYVAASEKRPYEAAFTGILQIDDLSGALTSIRELEKLRKKYLSDGDREGLRLVREYAISAKQKAAETSGRLRVDPLVRSLNGEIARWFTIWLQTPEAFENWVVLRQRSSEFIDAFGRVADH